MLDDKNTGGIILFSCMPCIIRADIKMPQCVNNAWHPASCMYMMMNLKINAAMEIFFFCKLNSAEDIYCMRHSIHFAK